MLLPIFILQAQIGEIGLQNHKLPSSVQHVLSVENHGTQRNLIMTYHDSLVWVNTNAAHVPARIRICCMILCLGYFTPWFQLTLGQRFQVTEVYWLLGLRVEPIQSMIFSIVIDLRGMLWLANLSRPYRSYRASGVSSFMQLSSRCLPSSQYIAVLWRYGESITEPTALRTSGLDCWIATPIHWLLEIRSAKKPGAR